MAGERILVVDEKQALQDIVRSTLDEFGYRIETASNGVAALSHPELDSFNLLLIDADMDSISGRETIKLLRGSEETVNLPVLLLVPEDKAEEMATESLAGAWNYLLKPFEPRVLLTKVRAMVDEKRILEQSETFVAQAADRRMAELAERQIAAAVERKTQIIIERAIQSVITQVDQRARMEVDQRVTTLSQEKEQELVRMTVREVANSMVEKLAERKVNEAIELVLHERTENAVRRAAENALPTMAREQIHEHLEIHLPEVVEMKVTEVAENQASEIGAKLVSVVEGVAQKSVPKIVNEKLPDLSARHLERASQTVLPPIVEQLTRGELDKQCLEVIEPRLTRATKQVKRIGAGFLIVVALAGIAILGFAFFALYTAQSVGAQGNALLGGSSGSSAAAAPAKVAAPAKAAAPAASGGDAAKTP